MFTGTQAELQKINQENAAKGYLNALIKAFIYVGLLLVIAVANITKNRKSFADLKQINFKKAFKNLLGIRTHTFPKNLLMDPPQKKEKEQEQVNRSFQQEHVIEESYSSSDSEDCNENSNNEEDNELAPTPSIENKPKKIFQRKNYGRGNVSKRHSATEPVTSPAVMTTTHAKIQKELRLEARQLIVNPNLHAALTADEKLVLKNLCVNPKIIGKKNKRPKWRGDKI